MPEEFEPNVALFSVFDSTNQAHILIKGKLTYLFKSLPQNNSTNVIP